MYKVTVDIENSKGQTARVTETVPASQVQATRDAYRAGALKGSTTTVKVDKV
jgi:hypothetical protein